MRQKFITGHAARLGQLALSCVIGCVCIWFLTGRIEAGFWADVMHAVRSVPLQAFVLSSLCTALSLFAVGRYDVVAHRHFGTGVSTRQACASGTIAIALAQTLGLGVLTGALARWRMLPSIDTGTALRLSAFVCLSFMAALLVVSAATCLILPAPALTFWPSLAVIAVLPLALAGAFLFPVIRLGRTRFTMPSLLAFGSILMWTALDVLAASAALYLLIPSGTVDFTTLFPLFLLALGASLLTGTPGGVGPFELVLFGALPPAAAAPVLGGVIAFRAVYYAVPALIAMGLMLRPFCAGQKHPAVENGGLDHAPRAEVGVIRQNGGFVLARARTQCAAWLPGQTLCALFDPLDRHHGDLVGMLSRAARARNLVPCLYKCSARVALKARTHRWAVAHIADEALIAPASFDTSMPPLRSLRRKLKAAQKAGIRISDATGQHSGHLSPVDADWQRARGKARGGTMGRFCPDYLSRQRVFVASQNGRVVAFATFHHTSQEWCLDLMRQTRDAPDGTMHMLVHHAIGAAAQRLVPQISLAATPACPDPKSALMRHLARGVVRKSGGPGLRQFKSCFRPRWQPLYAAAPNRLLLALALTDIAHAVLRPGVLPAPAPAHDNDENYEVASRLAS